MSDNLIELPRPKAYAIMASGTGTNALALVEHGIEIGRPPAFVVVNRKASPLLQEVPKRSIPIVYIPAKATGIDEDFEAKVIAKCIEYQVDWIFLAGFMKVLGPTFLSHFEVNHGINKVINIHPSLLPKYPGLAGYKQAYEAGDKTYGHTLHLVNAGVDEGPILYQKELPLNCDQPLDEVIEYGKRFENISYKKLLQYIVKNEITIEETADGPKAKNLPLDEVVLL